VNYSPQNVVFLLLIAWAIVFSLGRLFHLERRGIDVKPFYLMFRTKRFNDIMVKTASRHPSFWKMYGNLGIIASVPLISLAVYTLAMNLYHFVYVPDSASPVIPVVPGVTISLTYVPYILLAFGIAVTLHEGAHGTTASAEKIGLKSSGIIIAPVTFGGFVEPDEEQFEKANVMSKLRVLTSGSLTNLLAGLLTVLLLLALFSSQAGVLITAIQPNGPAAEAGMHDWDVIYAIGQIPIENYSALHQTLAGLRPGDVVLVDTQRGGFLLTTSTNPQNSSVAFLGITSLVGYVYHPLRIGEFSTLLTYNLNLSLDWIQLIMINLAIFNMLPMFPLDGDGFVYSILKHKLNSKAGVARTAINIVSFGLLGLNIALSFIRYGVTPF
jgi:membrane-associated protease RseP (regulator of RpoE activity)